MAVIEHPIKLNSEQHRAFAEKVIWQTVGIVNCRRDQITSPTEIAYSEGIGTGSACRWKDRDIILTAKHVLQDALPSDLRFFLRPSGQIDWNTRPEQPALSERVALRSEKIVRCREHDLAAVVLDRDRADRSSLQYCELPVGLVPPPPPGSGVFLAGYPSDQAHQVERTITSDGVTHRAFAVVGNGHWGSVVSEVPILSIDIQRRYPFPNWLRPFRDWCKAFRVQWHRGVVSTAGDGGSLDRATRFGGSADTLAP